METTCAVYRLSDGLILNTIIAAPSDPAPAGCGLAEIMAGQKVEQGQYYVGGVFRAPVEYAVVNNATGLVVARYVRAYGGPALPGVKGHSAVMLTPAFDGSFGKTWDGKTFAPPVA